MSTTSNPSSPAKQKHVVSVSIGSSQRDSRIETTLLGHPILMERRGTNGSINAAINLIQELDGHIDAFGLGGLDLYVQARNKRYYFRDSKRISQHAKQTPIVCGAGLKNTLERLIVEQLESVVHWSGKRVLCVSAVDRFGMAEALVAAGADVTFGDFIFALGVPVRVRRLGTVNVLAQLLMPVITRLPFQWLYPTGTKQNSTRSSWRERYFRDAEVIAGDYHFIKRYMPQDLQGKVVLTNTTTQADMDDLQARGVKTLITTTPRYNGRSLSTNLLEASFVALANKYPLSPADYTQLLAQSQLKPDITEF